jgi:hypothetical protein
MDDGQSLTAAESWGKHYILVIAANEYAAGLTAIALCASDTIHLHE